MHQEKFHPSKVSRSCLSRVSILSWRCFGVVVMSWSCFGDALHGWCRGIDSVVLQCFQADVPVMLWCVSVMFRWCLGGISLMLWWCLGVVSVAFQWCLGDVSVISRWFFGDVWVLSWSCFGDALLMFWGCRVSVMSRFVQGGVSAMCQWCLGEALVMRRWFSGLCRWFLSGVSVLCQRRLSDVFGDVSVMSPRCLNGVMVMLCWYLGLVSVLLSGCFADVSGMSHGIGNKMRQSIRHRSIHRKKVAVRLVFAIEVVCWAHSPSYVWGFFFSHPRSFHFVSLPLKPKCLWTSVLPFGPVSIINCKFSCKLVSQWHACIAKLTACKCGCGKCHSHFPTCKKERACICIFLLWAVALELLGS